MRKKLTFDKALSMPSNHPISIRYFKITLTPGTRTAEQIAEFQAAKGAVEEWYARNHK